MIFKLCRIQCNVTPDDFCCYQSIAAKVTFTKYDDFFFKSDNNKKSSYSVTRVTKPQNYDEFLYVFLFFVLNSS